MLDLVLFLANRNETLEDRKRVLVLGSDFQHDKVVGEFFYASFSNTSLFDMQGNHLVYLFFMLFIFSLVLILI